MNNPQIITEQQKTGDQTLFLNLPATRFLCAQLSRGASSRLQDPKITTLHFQVSNPADTAWELHRAAPMEQDEDLLGVLNALERTCELEAHLRQVRLARQPLQLGGSGHPHLGPAPPLQAIQNTHPLQTTLDWDFAAADKEREALLAIRQVPVRRAPGRCRWGGGTGRTGQRLQVTDRGRAGGALTSHLLCCAGLAQRAAGVSGGQAA